MAGGAEDDTLLGDFGIGDEVIVFADNLIDIDQICWGGGLTRIVCYHAPYSATFFRHVGYDYVKSCQLLCESCAGCLALGHFLLDFLQRLAVGLGHQAHHERDGQGRKHAENRERAAHIVAERIEQHEEELGDDEVAQPVRRRAEGGADAAHAQREDLTDKHPGDRAPRDRKAEDIESDENHRRHGQHAPLPVPAQEGIREVKVVQYQKVSEHFALPLVNQQKREVAR